MCKATYFCETIMPSEKDNILEFNQFMKSDKIPYIIYGDIESLIRKWIDGCVNNAENSSVTKIGGGGGVIFLAEIQCQLYGILIIKKARILYIVRNIVWKSFMNL